MGLDASACVCVVAGADDEHAKLEVRQGRIFVTAVSKTKGRVSGGGLRLFPGVAYPIPEGAEVTLGDGDAAVTLTAAQADGGAGTAGVDAMANLMQMQFAAISWTPRDRRRRWRVRDDVVRVDETISSTCINTKEDTV